MLAMVGDNLQGSTRGRLVVELAPGISTTVRWPRQEDTVDGSSQGELFRGDATELMSIAKSWRISVGVWRKW